MPLPVPHDIEQIVVQVVAHLVLDVVALRPVHHAPPRDDVEHGLGGFPGVRPHVGARRNGGEMLLDRMIESDGRITIPQMLGHIIVPWTDNLLPRIPDDIQELQLRNPLRPVIVDGFLDQRGYLLKVNRVLLHALGDGALGEARDHIGLGSRRGLLPDRLLERFFVEDIDRCRERNDLVGVNMLVQQLADPFFV